MIKKNENQLNFLYGKEAVDILKGCLQKAIHDGDYVTIDINSIEEFDSKSLFIAKFKLWVKRLRRRMVLWKR